MVKRKRESAWEGGGGKGCNTRDLVHKMTLEPQLLYYSSWIYTKPYLPYTHSDSNYTYVPSIHTQ